MYSLAGWCCQINPERMELKWHWNARLSTL